MKMTIPSTGNNHTVEMLEEPPNEFVYVLVAVALAGVAGNIFAGIIWSSDHDKASTSLYLTYLAFCDSLFLLSKVAGLLFILNFGVQSTLRDHSRVFIAIISTTKFSVYGTACLTVTVTINRCVALFKPFTYVSLCSRSTAKLLLTIIFFTCGLLMFPEVLRNVEGTSLFLSFNSTNNWNSYQNYNMICFFLESFIIYLAPGVLLLILNIVMFIEQRSHNSQFLSGVFRATRTKKPMDSIVAIGLLYLVYVIVGYTFLNMTSLRLKYIIHFDRLSLYCDIVQYVNACSKIVFYCKISEKFRTLRNNFTCTHSRKRAKAIDVNTYYMPLPWWLGPTQSENGVST